ncbi:hypothetical protein N665_0214s0002 [Sinapis alba]|nr:hypothetical protein N665_0214s0002 [Sinapis alba]
MVSLTSSSSSTPKISFDFTKNNNNSTNPNVHVSPFSSDSSYLGSKEAVVTAKVIEPCKTLKSNINPKDDQELGDEKKMVNKPAEDPELGVFGAEKYFNGDMDSDKSSSVLSLTNPEVERFVDDMKQSEKKSTGAPSVRSESSWNSQSMLLQNNLMNSCNGYVQEKKNNSGQIQKVVNNKKSFLLNLGCKCACSDVDVDDKILVKRSSDLIKIQKQEELVQRKSLEVAQKKLTLASWESRTEEEDTKSEGSDTSSDLFEIDNVTGKPKSFLGRQGSDPISPTCYAPSEVSIEWSIVTASAADYSVMSECATSPLGRNQFLQIPPRIPTKTAPQRRRPSSSGSGGFLMSCKSHKSVMVSGDSDRRSSMNKTSPSYVQRHPQVMETTKRKSFETLRRISNSSPSPLLYSQY